MGKAYTFEFVKEEFNKRGLILLEDSYKNCQTKMRYICSCGNDKETIALDYVRDGYKCSKCNRKVSYEFVSNFFKEQGCELLETEYIHSHYKMKYKCVCGNESSITWTNFKSGYRCQKCGGKKRGDFHRLPFEFIKSEFEKRGFTLISTEHINNKVPLEYLCDQGHKNKIVWGSFSRGCGCSKCASQKSAEMRRYKIEYVKEIFEKEGCTLLSTVYKNNLQKLDYICSCGEQSTVTFGFFLIGGRCKKCGIKKSAISKTYTYEFIKQEFEKAGCTLLSTTYTGNEQKLDYICKCNTHSQIPYSRFQQGGRCGCERSWGEKKIKDILDKNNINYEMGKRFEDCKNIRSLPFDFYIPNKNILIEYDGEQHFLASTFGGISKERAENILEGTQKRDAIKTAYCIEKEIKLIRIPYWEFDRIEEILTEELNKKAL